MLGQRLSKVKVISIFCLFMRYEPRHGKPYANNKGADQPECLRKSKLHDECKKKIILA